MRCLSPTEPVSLKRVNHRLTNLGGSSGCCRPSCLRNFLSSTVAVCSQRLSPHLLPGPSSHEALCPASTASCRSCTAARVGLVGWVVPGVAFPALADMLVACTTGKFAAISVIYTVGRGPGAHHAAVLFGAASLWYHVGMMHMLLARFEHKRTACAWHSWASDPRVACLHPVL